MLRTNQKFRSAGGKSYCVQRPLARGGQGQPYVVSDEAGAEFVMKDLHKEFHTAETRSRVEYLARKNLSRLSPALCAELDYIATDGMLAPISPLAPGELLEAALEKNPLPLPASLKVACALARGVAVLEDQEIAHGDLHPGNVIVEMRGSTVCGVKLIDLSNFVAPGVPAPPCLGQAYFMAPEIRLGGCRPDILSDRHALANMLHEIILRRHAAAGFEAEGEYERATAEWLHDPGRSTVGRRSPGGYPAEILNADLARLFRRGISAARDARPSASDWVQSLSRALFSISACRACGTAIIVDSAKRVCPGCQAPYPTLLLRSRYGTTPLSGTTTVVGRTDLGGESTVSERHAVFWRQGPDYALEDLSTNGTFRQSKGGWKRLLRSEPLPLVQAGDVLKFAKVEATLEVLK